MPADGHLFFDDSGLEFATLMALGAAPYGLTEAGEVLATVARIDAGDVATFDGYMAQYAGEAKGLSLEMAKRLEPYGTSSVGEVLVQLRQYDLTDVAGGITAPTWIAAPDDEQFWPGQSQELFDLITDAPKVLVPFTRAEGANWHCEPKAPRVRAQRMFDWLDQVLAASGAARG